MRKVSCPGVNSSLNLLLFVCQMMTITFTWHTCFDDGVRQPIQKKTGNAELHYAQMEMKYRWTGV